MIRLATYQDINEILTVIQDAKALLKSRNSLQWQDDDGYPHFQTFENDLINNHLFVYELEEKIVGVCCLGKNGEPTYDIIYNGHWLNRDRYYVVHRLAVKCEYYGKGIAKGLLKQMEYEAIKDQVFNIKVDTAFENTPMNNLLRHMGYIRCGVILLNRPNLIDNHRIAYQKILDFN